MAYDMLLGRETSRDWSCGIGEDLSQKSDTGFSLNPLSWFSSKSLSFDKYTVMIAKRARARSQGRPVTQEDLDASQANMTKEGYSLDLKSAPAAPQFQRLVIGPNGQIQHQFSSGIAERSHLSVYRRGPDGKIHRYRT